MDEIMRARIHDVVDQLLEADYRVAGIVLIKPDGMAVCWGTDNVSVIREYEDTLRASLESPLLWIETITTRIVDDRGRKA